MTMTTDDVFTLQNQNCCIVSYDAIIEACDGEPFPMSLTGDDEIMEVVAIVNQGIDSRLQACNCPARGDSYKGGERSFIAKKDGHRWKKGEKVVHTRTLECIVSPESLPVLIRRLFEDDSSLAGDIMEVLGFNDTGVFVGRD